MDEIMDQQHGGHAMSDSTSGRPTVAQVAAQQGHLEGRITGLERDMQNMSQAVSALTETVSAGFRDTREMMTVAARRQDERTSELHARFDKQSEKRQWSPSIIISAIACAVIIGGCFGGFVHMTTSPITQDILEARADIDAQHSLGEQLLLRQVEHADATGYARAQVEELRYALHNPKNPGP